MALITNDSIPRQDAHGESVDPVALRPVEVIAIHSAIFQRFTSKHCIEGFMSYQKAREVCSLDDLGMNFAMAEKINAFFDNWLVSNPSFSYKYVDDAFRTSVSPAEEAEYKKVVTYHATQPRIIDAVNAYLTPKKFDREKGVSDGNTVEATCISPCSIMAPDEVTLSYRVVPYQSSIYIVVEEGFLEQMENKVSKLKFISDVLKTAYGMMPINTVNCCQWYDIYLNELRESSPQ